MCIGLEFCCSVSSFLQLWLLEEICLVLVGLEDSHRLWKHRDTCALWCSIIMLPWLRLKKKGTAIATVVIRDVFTYSLSGCRVGFLFPGAGRFQGRGEVWANISWVKVNDGAVEKHLWLRWKSKKASASEKELFLWGSTLSPHRILKVYYCFLTNTRTVSENKLQQMREENY